MSSRMGKRQQFVYFVLAPSAKAVKIGITTDIPARINAIRAVSPVEIELLREIPANVETERQLHKKFSHLRMHGEWFRYEAELQAAIASGEIEAIQVQRRKHIVVKEREIPLWLFFHELMRQPEVRSRANLARRMGVGTSIVSRWRSTRGWMSDDEIDALRKTFPIAIEAAASKWTRDQISGHSTDPLNENSA